MFGLVLVEGGAGLGGECEDCLGVARSVGRSTLRGRLLSGEEVGVGGEGVAADLGVDVGGFGVVLVCGVEEGVAPAADVG